MPTANKLMATLITLAALVAMGISAYLAWASWTAGEVAGCTADGAFDCDTVLVSRWSKWFGVPVAAFGTVAYLGIIAAAWPAAARPQSGAMSLLLALSLAATGAACWFVGLQLFELQSFCFYCMLVHTCGLLIAGLALTIYFTADPYANEGQPRAVVGMSASQIPSVMANRGTDEPVVGPPFAALLAAIGVALLVAGQLLGPDSSKVALREIELKPVASAPNNVANVDRQSPDFMENQPITRSVDSEEQRNPERLVSFVGLPHPIDAYNMPLVGSRDAKHVLVEMLDYTCTHCRELHPRLIRARERYGDPFCIALYHAPLSADCNDHLAAGKKGRPSACEYARLAITVWMLAPEHFTEYHNWLMEGRLPPSVAKAKQRAMALAGNRVLLDDKLKADITARLRQQCDDWHALDSGLPILLFGESAVTGGGKTDEELFANFEERLGLQPERESDE